MTILTATYAEMEDTEYMEILHVENLQREDVHPLDEAIGYKELLERGGYDVITLAARIGKSETHVYQRIKLNDLIKEGQKLFLADQIGFGHAVILARLDRKQQKDILANHLFSYQQEPVSVRELSDYVRSYLYLDLGNVPWALDDADLVQEAGPCSFCPKRAGSNPSLFTDMQNNTCTDRGCFEKKMLAHIQKQIDSQPGLLKFSDYPKAAAKYLGICGDTLKKITDLGQLRAFNMNGRRAYRLEDLEAYVESLPEWYDSTGEKSAKVLGDRRIS